MNRGRFVGLLLAAFVVICGALYFSAQRDATREPQGIALLPSLATEVNAVTAVVVRKGSATPALTVHKTGADWTVAERADYPADVGKLRKLLLSLRDARIVEEKTADPARFPVIGVEDPGTPGASGAEVTIVTPTTKFAVIVGKPVGEGNFVRRVGNNQTYSVEPGINVDANPRSWIDPQLLDVAAALIQRIDIEPAAGQPAPGVSTPGQSAASRPAAAPPGANGAYSLHRANPADNTYTLDGVPAGRKAQGAAALAPGPTTFTGLTAEDVSPSSAIDFSHAAHAIVTLSDGNVITLTGAVVADKHWVQIQASKDAALTAKAAGRAFEIASYRYDDIFKPLEQLLEPKAAPAAPAASIKKGAPARAPNPPTPTPAP
jgi:hypothetical protein